MSIGLRIKKLRENRGISQAALAKLIDVSAGNVGEWEKERSKPGADALVSLSTHFNVSTDYLLTGNKLNDTQLLERQFNSISPEDLQVIEKYLELSERHKGKIEVYIDNFLESYTIEKNKKSYLSTNGEEAATSESETA